MKNHLTGESLYAKLCEMGASRWTKGDYDRIYLNRAGRDLLGLTLEHYNTGNIRSAELNGESISNSRARELCAWLETVYYDCKTGKLCWRAGTCPNSDYADDLLDAINTIESDDDLTPESDETPASDTSKTTVSESGDTTDTDSNETPVSESGGDPTPESSKTTVSQETKTGAAAKSSDGPVPHETAVPSASARRSAAGSSAAAPTPGDPHPLASAPVSTPASPSAPTAAAAPIHAPAP